MLHRFSRNGVFLALDTESGAVHILNALSDGILTLFADASGDEIAPRYQTIAYRKELSAEIAAALDAFSKAHGGYTKQEIEEAYSELCELYDEGMLYSSRIIPARKGAPVPIKAMCLHVAHDCNMRCRYCFASMGDFGGERGIMTPETGRAAIDFILDRSLKIRNLEIDFFGGEPLLAMETVTETVSYARRKEKEYGKNFRFTITTNGTLLDCETIDFINREMSNVVLSIDGRQNINDKTRYFEDGGGSYDIILPLYKKLVARRGDQDYYVRGTFTRHNLDFSEDVFHLAREGFEQISIEPVVTKDKELALTEEHLEQICKEYDRLADRIIQSRKQGRYFNFFHFFIDLEEGPCVYKRVKGCGSGSEYVAVTPSGEIYPCHQFVGLPEFQMGSVHTKTIDEQKRDLFSACSLDTGLKECAGCWAKYFCGGGCAANHYKFNGDLTKPYKMACAMQQKRTECALYIKAIEAMDTQRESVETRKASDTAQSNAAGALRNG